MRKYCFFIVILACANLSFAAEQSIKLKLEEVKIYLAGAELTHSANVRLKPGNNEVILENIANNIQPNSINVSLSGNASIMDINEQQDYLQSTETSSDVKMLEDSLKLLSYKISEINNEIQALDAQADLLSKNQVISGKDKVMTVAELKQVSDYYFETMLKIKNSKLKLGRDIAGLEEKKTKIQGQLNELNGKKNISVHQIVMNINSKTSESMDIIVKYLINDAAWSPFYDVRVANTNSNVLFQHKANVWQNSGLDFNDVNLKLSTRNPSIYGDKPVITASYLRFVEKTLIDVVGLSNGVISSGSGYSFRGSRAKETQIRLEGNDIASLFEENNTITDVDLFDHYIYTISAEYITDLKYTIPSDGKPHLVDLNKSEAPALYEYYAAPKYQKDAFLIAKIKDWEDLNLLPGAANVFFENSYIGQSALHPEITQDDMSVSLGVDKAVIITRDRVKDFTESKFLSSDIERYLSYNVNVKNTKKTKIKITIEDQIPVTTNEDIAVNPLELSDGKLEKDTGKIQWIMELEPGQSVQKQVRYSVRHPKDQTITE